MPQHSSEVNLRECITCTSLSSVIQVSHYGFETQRRHHQKSKTGVSVGPQESIMSFKKIQQKSKVMFLENPTCLLYFYYPFLGRWYPCKFGLLVTYPLDFRFIYTSHFGGGYTWYTFPEIHLLVRHLWRYILPLTFSCLLKYLFKSPLIIKGKIIQGLPLCTDTPSKDKTFGWLNCFMVTLSCKKSSTNMIGHFNFLSFPNKIGLQFVLSCSCVFNSPYIFVISWKKSGDYTRGL